LPHGLKVAACEDCAELVEAFAVHQPSVMFVARQPIADHRTEQRDRARRQALDGARLQLVAAPMTPDRVTRHGLAACGVDLA
jgi:hypothetical protein